MKEYNRRIRAGHWPLPSLAIIVEGVTHRPNMRLPPMRSALALSCLLAITLPARSEQPLPKVPAGFKIEVVLQAPDIEAPTALCVAPNGDVYFAEDPMDMSGPPTKNLDRIWLLKGGDAKKKILIADKMWAVMGMEIVRDKLYVVHAPYVTAFTLDTEGKVKERRDLFKDLGPPVAGLPSFNDHIPSGIRMGMDGWLYVSIGDKGIPKMTRKEERDGSVHVAEGRLRHSDKGRHISLEGGGVIRFRPDGSGLEVFASGTRNHLDVPMDENDRIFVRDNTDDGDGWNTRFMYLPPGAFMGYPWAFKQHPKEALPMIHDFGGGSPCGGWVYCDDGLPDTYRGRIFHCEWGKGKVLAVKVLPDGGGFKLVDEIKFIDPEGTAYKDFRPYTLRPTADGGGFYVTDWGYSGWLAKVKAGRLLKVTYVNDDVKPQPRGPETDKIEELVKRLGHPAHSERLRAQRALIALGKDAAAPLKKRLKGEFATFALRDDLSPEAKRHALWVLRAVDNFGIWTDVAMRAVKDDDAGVRLQAVRVLGSYVPPKDQRALGEGIRGALLRQLFNDSDPQVRLHAARGLAFNPPDDCFELVAGLEEEQDAWVRVAIVRAVKRCDWKSAGNAFFKQASRRSMTPLIDGMLLALTDAYDLDAVAILRKLVNHKDPVVRARAVAVLARMYHDRKPYAGTWWGTQPEKQPPPARVVAWQGTSKVRESLIAALADQDAAVRKAVVAGLLAIRDPATLDPLTKQFAEEKDANTRADIVRAVAGLHLPAAAEFLGTVAKDDKESERPRLEAIAGLETVKTQSSVEILASLAAPSQPVPLQVRALEGLGVLKLPAGKQACVDALKSKEAPVRLAAVLATARVVGAESVELLTPLLKDKESHVRLEVVKSLGSLKSKAAIPVLLRAATDKSLEFPAILALAQTPDSRALSAYLTGLGSKNADLRTSCRGALSAIREQITPALKELVKRNEVPATLLPELRSIYSTYSPILNWRLIGPIPDDGKIYPPQVEQKFDATYKIGGKDLKWQEAKGDAKNHGKVELASRFKPNTDVVAYGYAEIDSAGDRDAQLLVGSDDSIVIWINGKKVHEFLADRGWAHDQEKVNIKLVKGRNRLLIKCGNHSGPWEYSVAVSSEPSKYDFLQGGARKFDLEEFRAFARKNAGDAERGHKLFMDAKGLACVKCHAVGGMGGQVGPSLDGIGLKYQREDLMTSILEPSKVIAQGYETIIIVTKKGKTLTGVFKGETGDAVRLVDKEGMLHTVAKKDIEDREFSPVSIMPNGLSDGMTLQDFADLIAYMQARGEDKAPPKK
jgi:putative heme-binding domain-containing protein